jgi:pimeloyl-ACP methyl ester carboxylesterase
MSNLHTGFAKINGATLYYEIAGQGPVLVMLHGHLLDSRQWDDQFAAFADSYRVLRYDARGFGQSSLPPEPYSHVADLYRLLRFLDIEQAYLMGCSGGGALCIDCTLQHPQMVAGLILLGSSVGGYQPTGQAPPTLIAMHAALQSGDLAQAVELSLQVFTDGPRRTAQEVNAAARERTRTMSAQLFARPPVPEATLLPLDPPALERLAEIRVPTLVIVGAEDDQMLHDIADLIASRVPQAHRHIIADAGHHPNLEHPDAFNQMVTAFLDQAR